jgi:hypothetical protein
VFPKIMVETKLRGGIGNMKQGDACAMERRDLKIKKTVEKNAVNL